MIKLRITRFFLFPFALFLMLLSSCAKEYSIEGLGVPANDTLLIPAVIKDIPSCKLCNDTYGTLLATWSLQTNNTVLCGIIDTAIVSPARTAFTFYGPSSCSRDSGMVISVFLPNDTLNKDRQNIILDRNAFYYYDRITPSDILVTRQNTPFTVIIKNYDHQTKIATGSFEGNVFKPTGGGTRVSLGKFQVKLI